MLNSGTSDDTADEGRFRLAMASSGIGMAIVGLDGRWLDVNPAMERMFGRPAAEFLDRTASDFTHPDDLGISRDYLDGIVSGKTPVIDAEKRYLRADGATIWVHVNVAAMRGAAGDVIYLIAQLRDVTRQRSAEAALAKLNDSLEARVVERTDELETVNRQQEILSYGISHDLRAPLRAIDNFAALLDAHGQLDDDTGRDYLARIRAASKRMGTLVDALLELSRASRAELRATMVDVSLLAEWALAELSDAEPSRVTTLDVQSGLQAHGDERQLKLMLDQVLHNAWKFSRDRERVEITVTGEREGDRIRITVRDRGIGFDMRYAHKLFEPFQRLHGSEQSGGNGIGLAIAQRIVERHRGKVWAESELDAGSAFHIELPASEAASGSATG